jgi:Trk K+ transport system NAD-binding subunit
MLASLCRNHFIVIGVGKVGYQVVRGLLELKETVVVVELTASSLLLDELYEKGIPVVQGNARLSSVLEQAGVKTARAVIISTSDDLTNLDVAMTARDLNPDTQIVIRLFDETLATKVAGAFAMPTISTSQVVAPAFIAAATGRKVYQEFHLSGQQVHLTDVQIGSAGRLIGRTIGEIQADNRINVVMHQSRRGVDVNPGPDAVLEAGDTVLVIAPLAVLLEFEQQNQPRGERGPRSRPPSATIIDESAGSSTTA